MSEATVPAHDVVHEHHGPTDREYVKIAAILAALTAIEVATYFVDVGEALVPILMVLMVIKFFMVAAWFMHLKYDSSLFTKIFVTGLVLASGVYIAALSAFKWWDAFDF